jgi:glycosyltransferase involved in cell wall biosynthesis
MPRVKMLRKLVIIPAFNEAETLPSLVEELCLKAPDFDYVVVNDGSRDNTEEVCEENGIHCIDLPVNLGIGGAVQTGYVYAWRTGYDIAVQLDGDGQHDPAFLTSLVGPILAGEADFTIGSRYLSATGFQSTILRRTGSRWLNGVIRLLTRKRITDSTSGFRAANRIAMRLFVGYYPYDYPEPETIVDVLRHRLRITEVPVDMRDRQGGSSSIRLTRTAYYMLKVTLAMFVSMLKKGG